MTATYHLSVSMAVKPGGPIVPSHYTQVKTAPRFAAYIVCTTYPCLNLWLQVSKAGLVIAFCLPLESIYSSTKSAPPHYILDTCSGFKLENTSWQWSEQLIPSISSLIKSSLPQVDKAILLKHREVKNLKW